LFGCSDPNKGRVIPMRSDNLQPRTYPWFTAYYKITREISP
jgi:hypothetical protein